MNCLFSRLGLLFVVLALIFTNQVTAAPSPKEEAPAAKKEAKKESPAPKEKTAAAKKKPPAKGKKQPESTEASSESQKASPKSPAEKPSVYTVKKGPFKIQVSLKGVLEAQAMTEIVLRPQIWTDLKVLKVVEHGTSVKRGDLLVALEMEKLDRAIADLRTEQRLSDLALKQAEEELQTLEKSTPLDLAWVERAKRVSDEDLARYLKVERPMTRKAVDLALKMAEEYCEYQREELRQLEKMYKADDLTEETEEIVLRRARNALKRAEFMLERAELQHEQMVKLGLAREDENVNELARRQTLATNQAKATLPLLLKKSRLELEKMKIERTRSEEKLKKLLSDRALMTVKSPADGVVYYGQCTRGKWTGVTQASERLHRGGALSANTVFMTIVGPRPVFVRATVPEKELHHARAGLKGTARPIGYPDLRLPAIVNQVDAVPTSNTNFQAKITIALDRQAEQLMPGMTCTVKLVAYEKKDALCVPARAVSTDELDDQKHYVYLVGKKGKPKKQAVTIGKKTDKQVEILKGLSEGGRILAEAPNDKS